MGVYNLAADKEDYPQLERLVQWIVPHPKFNSQTFEYDLALLRFYQPVRYQPNVIPICLPEEDSAFIGRMGHITGWGRLYDGKSFFMHLQFEGM